MKKMHLSKRLFTIVMVLVMLSAGSLTYFAFAEDAAPCGVVTHCPECGIGTCTPQSYYGLPDGLTSHTAADGSICWYQYKTYYEALVCDSCGYKYVTYSCHYNFNHQCGMADGF